MSLLEGHKNSGNINNFTTHERATDMAAEYSKLLPSGALPG